MSSHSPISKQYQSSSESGDSLSDSFLDSEAALNATGNSGSKDFMANDYTLGLGSPRSYISALDQDVSHYERRNDAAMRELFLATQPYTEEHGDLPKGDFIHSEIHSPSQFRAKSLISGESQYLSRPNHHTHHPLPHIVTENLDSAVDTSMLMASSAGYTLESNSATTGSSSGGSPRGDSENWTEDRNDKTQPASRTRKTRREKPRIQLAPDQPPTTQGKPRSRVYVACVQCRTRKIRCDGAKPACHNCSRRTTSSGGTCSYDTAPKRRGPDKTPGARQRTARDGSQEEDSEVGPVRRRRRRRDTSGSGPAPRNSSGKRSESYEAQSPIDFVSPISPVPITPISALSEVIPESWSSLVPARHPQSVVTRGRDYVDSDDELFSPYGQEFDVNSPEFTFIGGFSRGFANPDFNDEERKIFNIAAEPSLEFTRKTWWDSLLSTYSSTSPLDPLALTSTQRENAASTITADLRFLFRASNYWFSFFNVPRFFGNFFNPETRDRMQPSLILSACALAIFWQSSEIGRGKPGRDLALQIRDQAESSLQASLNAGWIDETLAQAAWMLAIFEVCAHPQHSTQRSMSAMIMLDQIIRTLSLTFLDADNPEASVFVRGEVPRVRPEVKSENPLATLHEHHDSSPDSPCETIVSVEGCNCASLSLGHQWASAFEHTPLWLSTPAWDESWTDGEIRKESCRRLCWSTVILAAGHSSYATANKTSGLDLFVTDPANYALLFPGEALTPSQYAKNSIWSLNYRTMLLWHSCARMRHDTQATETEKARFATAAWLEVDALEEALNAHTCGLERAFLFQGREYLFNTRMCISYEFQRFIPLASANVSGAFHRRKAEEWLTHQATVAKQVMHGLHTVTGQGGSGSLTQRPFFVFWFMSQISRALSLWACDNTLSVALDVSKVLLAPIDYLTALWPCHEQRTRYERLREQLDQACIFAGLPLPSPPNLTLPTSPTSALSIPIRTSASLLSLSPSASSPSNWGSNYETADPLFVRTIGVV